MPAPEPEKEQRRPDPIEVKVTVDDVLNNLIDESKYTMDLS